MSLEEFYYQNIWFFNIKLLVFNVRILVTLLLIILFHTFYGEDFTIDNLNSWNEIYTNRGILSYKTINISLTEIRTNHLEDAHKDEYFSLLFYRLLFETNYQNIASDIVDFTNSYNKYSDKPRIIYLPSEEYDPLEINIQLFSSTFLSIYNLNQSNFIKAFKYCFDLTNYNWALKPEVGSIFPAFTIHDSFWSQLTRKISLTENYPTMRYYLSQPIILKFLGQMIIKSLFDDYNNAAVKNDGEKYIDYIQRYIRITSSISNKDQNDFIEIKKVLSFLNYRWFNAKYETTTNQHLKNITMMLKNGTWGPTITVPSGGYLYYICTSDEGNFNIVPDYNYIDFSINNSNQIPLSVYFAYVIYNKYACEYLKRFGNQLGNKVKSNFKYFDFNLTNIEGLKVRIDYNSLHDILFTIPYLEKDYGGSINLGDCLALTRNYIYAKNGFPLKDKKWIDLFNGLDWYKPNATAISNHLSSIDKINIETLLEYEKLLKRHNLYDWNISMQKGEVLVSATKNLLTNNLLLKNIIK